MAARGRVTKRLRSTAPCERATMSRMEQATVETSDETRYGGHHAPLTKARLGLVLGALLLAACSGGDMATESAARTGCAAGPRAWRRPSPSTPRTSPTLRRPDRVQGEERVRRQAITNVTSSTSCPLAAPKIASRLPSSGSTEFKTPFTPTDASARSAVCRSYRPPSWKIWCRDRESNPDGIAPSGF